MALKGGTPEGVEGPNGMVGPEVCELLTQNDPREPKRTIGVEKTSRERKTESENEGGKQDQNFGAVRGTEVPRSGVLPKMLNTPKNIEPPNVLNTQTRQKFTRNRGTHQVWANAVWPNAVKNIKTPILTKCGHDKKLGRSGVLGQMRP